MVTGFDDQFDRNHFQQKLASPNAFMAACQSPSRSVTVEKPDDGAAAFMDPEDSKTSSETLDEPSEGAKSVTNILDMDLDPLPCTPGNFETQQEMFSTTAIVQPDTTLPKSDMISMESTDARHAKVGETDTGSNPKDSSSSRVKLFSSNLPRPQISPIVGSSLGSSASQSRIEQPDILLEFDPPIPPSPAVRDLMDVEFHQVLDTSDRPSTMVEQEQPSTVKHEAGLVSDVREIDEIEASSESQSSLTADIVDYLEEVGLINDALALSRHNREKLEKLVQRKAKLVELVANSRSKIAESSTELVAHPTHGISAATRDSDVTVGVENPSQSEVADSPIEKPLENIVKSRQMSNEQEPSSTESPLRRAVRAAPFVPRSCRSSVLSSCIPSPVRDNRKSAFPNDEATIGEDGTTGRSRLGSASTTGSVLRTAASDSRVDFLCQELTDKLTFHIGQRNDNRQESLVSDLVLENDDTVNNFSSSVSFGTPSHLRNVSDQPAEGMESNNRPLFNTPVSTTSSNLQDPGPSRDLFLSRYATPMTESSPVVGQAEKGDTVRSSNIRSAPAIRSLATSKHASTEHVAGSERNQKTTSDENTHYWRKNLYSSRHASVDMKSTTDSEMNLSSDTEPSPQRSPARSISPPTSRYAY
jgi:hypothetical protein